MKKIDREKPLAEQFCSIDFSTFQCGDEYVIAYRDRKDECSYSQGHSGYKIASIGHFRHGIAIAHVDSQKDCLVNTHCEVIYDSLATPHHCDIKICRVLEGFKIMWEEDVAAPGKDWQWVNKDCIIQEHLIIANANKDYHTDICNYPYGVNPEKGKIIRFGNRFYDFETYDLLFSLPSTLKILEHTSLNKISIDVFDKEDFKDFIIIDSQYFRDLIVKVCDSKIISFYEFPIINDEKIKRLLEPLKTDQRVYLQYWGLDAQKYINYLFEDGGRHHGEKRLKQCINPQFNLFAEFEELRDFFTIAKQNHDSLASSNKIDWIAHIRSKADFSREEILVRFGSNYYIICYCNSDIICSKFYLFDIDGYLINIDGYDDIRELCQKGFYEGREQYHDFIFNRNNLHGIAYFGRRSSTSTYKECILFQDNQLLGAEGIRSRNSLELQIGIDIPNFIETSHWGSLLYYKPNVEKEMVSAICVYNGDKNSIDDFDDSDDCDFYAGINNKLEKVYVNDRLPITTVIDKYLYKLPNNYCVYNIDHPIYDCYRGEYFWQEPIVWRDWDCNHYSTEKINIATKEASDETEAYIKELCKSGNPYIKHIEKLYALSDSSESYYLFEYRPFGKMDNEGNITYEFGDPSKIEL